MPGRSGSKLYLFRCLSINAMWGKSITPTSPSPKERTSHSSKRIECQPATIFFQRTKRFSSSTKWSNLMWGCTSFFCLPLWISEFECGHDALEGTSGSCFSWACFNVWTAILMTSHLKLTYMCKIKVEIWEKKGGSVHICVCVCVGVCACKLNVEYLNFPKGSQNYRLKPAYTNTDNLTGQSRELWHNFSSLSKKVINNMS